MSGDPLTAIETGLAELGVEYRVRFADATSEQSLRAVRAEILGKKGTLTRVLRAMGQVPASERPRIGERVNAVRAEVDAAFDGRLAQILSAARQAELEAAG